MSIVLYTFPSTSVTVGVPGQGVGLVTEMVLLTITVGQEPTVAEYETTTDPVPADKAVTKPDEETLATFGLLDDQAPRLEV